MRTLRCLLLATGFTFVAPGCGGHSAGDPLVASQARQLAPTMTLATGCAPAPLPPEDFVFSPQTHPARSYPNWVAPPPLDSLPRLALNTGCTRPGNAMESVARRSTPPPIMISSSGARPGPTDVHPPAKSRKDVPAPTGGLADSSGASVEGGSVHGASSPTARAPAAASPPPPPAPPAAPAMSPSQPVAAASSDEKSSRSSADRDSESVHSNREMPEPEQPVSTVPFAPPAPCPVPLPPDPSDHSDSYRDWGRATFLSNDDTMSLSSAQRTIFSIDHYLPIRSQFLRRHEFLNYFSFQTAPLSAGNDFSVQPSLVEKEGAKGTYYLSLAVRGRSLDVDSRRNLSLTVLVDRSGSMREEGRMNFLKRGLHTMFRQLKSGDIVNLVTFNTSACVPLQSFVVGRDPVETLQKAVDSIQPQGNTDLQVGLQRAYDLADQSYRPGYNHRVLLITDAQANTGETNPELLSMASRYFDRRQIRLSGIGVGKDFNDRLLDRLTERGKGAYVFLGSDAEVDAVFGKRFVSLVETVALDTHFLLHLPPSLRMNVFYGEESSARREDVQAVHFFANNSQLFFAEIMARHGKLNSGDSIMLGIEYRDPQSGEKRLEEHAFRIDQLKHAQTSNIAKAKMILEFIEGLDWMSSRVPVGLKAKAQPRGWIDDRAAIECQRRENSLRRMSQELQGDPETRRVLSLWNKYCERFEVPSGRRSDSWPGAVD